MVLVSTGTDDIISWPEVTLAISLLLALVPILGGATATFVELRKAMILNKMQDGLLRGGRRRVRAAGDVNLPAALPPRPV